MEIDVDDLWPQASKSCRRYERVCRLQIVGLRAWIIQQLTIECKLLNTRRKLVQTLEGERASREIVSLRGQVFIYRRKPQLEPARLTVLDLARSPNLEQGRWPSAREANHSVVYLSTLCLWSTIALKIPAVSREV